MVLAFKIIVAILGLIGLFTGMNDFIRGAGEKGDFENLADTASKPMLNFTIRFLGAIWAGFGALLILFITDLKRYDIALIMALSFIIIGGIGRCISIKQFGVDNINKTAVYIILIVELIIVTAVLIWYLFSIRTYF